MEKLSYKSLPFEAKASGDGSTFEGYCSAFHALDHHGDIVAPGAFLKCLPEFLKTGVVMFQHGEPIGRPVEAREDERGLFVRAVISATSTGTDVRTLLKDGVIRKMSIGYRTMQAKELGADDVAAYWAEQEYMPSAEELTLLGQFGKYGGVRLLTEVRLFEFSPVAFPANGQADITRVKKRSQPPERGTEPGRSFGDASRELVSDLGEFRDSAKSRQDIRRKAGRVLSESNRSRIRAVCDAIRPMLDDLEKLLEATAAKEPAKSSAPPPSPTREALRARSLRLRSAALATQTANTPR